MPKITLEKLITQLTELQKHSDPEVAHNEADDLLLEFINDKRVTQAYNRITRWYA